MNVRALLPLLVLLLQAPALLRAQPLLPILEHGSYGYIDTSGRVAIAPRFHAVGTFSGGLAAAREGGQYGYIDTTGRYVIAPQFDYAEAFDTAAEAALVWRAGMANAIDRSGTLLFERWYRGLSIIDEDRFVVMILLPVTESLADSTTRPSSAMTREMLLQSVPATIGAGIARLATSRDSTVPAWGVIDRRGRVILDTVYDELVALSRDMFLIRRAEGGALLDFSDNSLHDTVVGRDGRTLIAAGSRFGFGSFSEGRAAAHVADSFESTARMIWAYVDTRGHIVQRIPEAIGALRTSSSATIGVSERVLPLHPYVDGRAAILLANGGALLLYRDGRVRSLPWKVNDVRLLHGGTLLIDTARGAWMLATDEGKPILSFPLHFYASGPNWGRDYLLPDDLRWRRFASSGASVRKEIDAPSAEEIIFAYRESERRWDGNDSTVWYAITARGQVLDSLVERHDKRWTKDQVWEGSTPWRVEDVGSDVIWMTRYVDSQLIAHFWDPSARRVVGPFPRLSRYVEMIDGVLVTYTEGGLIDRMEDSIVFLARDGRTLWSSPPLNDLFIPFNLDHQPAPHYYTSQPPRPIRDDITAGTISLRVEGERPFSHQPGGRARTVTIANATEDSLSFFLDFSISGHPFSLQRRSRFSFPLVMEARDEEGVWRPIEAPIMLNIRGHGTIQLFTFPSRTEVTIALPEYDGSIETTLRLRMRFTPQGSHETLTIYSNEFPGRINPGQWWRHQLGPSWFQ